MAYFIGIDTSTTATKPLLMDENGQVLYGAALLAVAGSGVFRSVESTCDATITITGNISPGTDQSVYDQLYPLYRELYPALRPTFTAVGRERQ